MSTKGRPPTIITSNEVSPEAVDKLRARVFQTVNKNLKQVDEVLAGRRTWSNQQVKLYLSMLDKVMPNLTASHKTVDINTRPMEEWSNEELVAMLERARNAEANHTAIDVEELPPQELTLADVAIPIDEEEFAALEAATLESFK